jgi:hypothetical protein
MKLGLDNLEELVSFASKAGFDFTVEELKATNSGKAAEELSLEDLEKVTGGVLIDNEGHLLTTVCYGCEHWEARRSRAWLAVKGLCGSCRFWIEENFWMFGVPGHCFNEKNEYFKK